MVLQLWVPHDFDTSKAALVDPARVRVVTVGSPEFFDLVEARRGRRRLTYVVKKGDDLKRIGKKFNLTVADLERINRFGAAHTELAVGQKLTVYVPMSAGEKAKAACALTPGGLGAGGEGQRSADPADADEDSSDDAPAVAVADVAPDRARVRFPPSAPSAPSTPSTAPPTASSAPHLRLRRRHLHRRRLRRPQHLPRRPWAARRRQGCHARRRPTAGRDAPQHWLNQFRSRLRVMRKTPVTLGILSMIFGGLVALYSGFNLVFQSMSGSLMSGLGQMAANAPRRPGAARSDAHVQQARRGHEVGGAVHDGADGRQASSSPSRSSPSATGCTSGMRWARTGALGWSALALLFLVAELMVTIGIIQPRINGAMQEIFARHAERQIRARR